MQQSILDWPRRLPTTRWSVVLAAAAGGEDARDALGELYRMYFFPVASMIAARHGRELAPELTQAFFVKRLLDRRDLAKFRREKARYFRGWLFTAVRNFLKSEWRHERRDRRDIRMTEALDFESEQIRFLQEPRSDPERQLQRARALRLLGHVLNRVRAAYLGSEAPDAQQRFEAVKGFLPGREVDEPRYGPVAARLNMTPDAVKQLVFRLREHFAALLREEVRARVDGEAEVEAGMRFLCRVLLAPPPSRELT